MKELVAKESVADVASVDLSLLDDLSTGIDATVQETADASERDALLTAATDGAAAGAEAAAREYEQVESLTLFQAYLLKLQSEEPIIRRHVMGIIGDLTLEHVASARERARARLAQALGPETDSFSAQDRVQVSLRLIHRSLEGALNEQTFQRRGILAYAAGVADGLRIAIAAQSARLPIGAPAELNRVVDELLRKRSAMVQVSQTAASSTTSTSGMSGSTDSTSAASTDTAPGSTTNSTSDGQQSLGAAAGIAGEAVQDPRTCAADSNRVLMMVALGQYACADKSAVHAVNAQILTQYVNLASSNQCSEATTTPARFAVITAERDPTGLLRPVGVRCSP